MVSIYSYTPRNTAPELHQVFGLLTRSGLRLDEMFLLGGGARDPDLLSPEREALNRGPKVKDFDIAVARPHHIMDDTTARILARLAVHSQKPLDINLSEDNQLRVQAQLAGRAVDLNFLSSVGPQQAVPHLLAYSMAGISAIVTTGGGATYVTDGYLKDKRNHTISAAGRHAEQPTARSYVLRIWEKYPDRTALTHSGKVLRTPLVRPTSARPA